MINSLRGQISHKEQGGIYLEQFGIEWKLLCSASTIAASPALGARAKFFIHLIHKEDLMALYAFYSLEERSLFLELISSSGIGPKVALKILSSMSTQAIIRALDEEDIASLVKIPGLGKKTAEKLILQVRGKLLAPSSDNEKNIGAKLDDMELALINMGFAEEQTKLVLKQLRDDNKEAISESELLRLAIVQLTRS